MITNICPRRFETYLRGDFRHAVRMILRAKGRLSKRSSELKKGTGRMGIYPHETMQEGLYKEQGHTHDTNQRAQDLLPRDLLVENEISGNQDQDRCGGHDG